MNDNFVKKFEDATINFCNVFEECENNISNYKDQIDKLEKEIKENEQLYKLGNGQKAKDITAESVFADLSDADKINLSTTAQNDRVKAVDDTGNLITDYNNLNYETKKYFEDTAKQMRSDRKDKENENKIANLRINNLHTGLRAVISENYSKLLIEKGKFNAAIGSVDIVNNDYAHEINKCNAEIRNIAADSSLTPEEMDQRIIEQQEKSKKASAGQAVCKALKNASNVYSVAFGKVLNAIDPNNANYQSSVGSYLDNDNREKIVDELNVLDNLNELIRVFSQVKDNYDEEKKLIDEIKSQTKEFAKKHGRGDDFVKAVNSAVNGVNKAIKEVEKANGVDLSQGQTQQQTQNPPVNPNTPPDPSQNPPTQNPPVNPNTPPAQNQNPPAPSNQQNQMNGTVADLTAEAIKIRSVRRCRAHDRELMTAIPALAAYGLGMATGVAALPYAAAGLAGLAAVFVAGDLGSRFIDYVRRGCVNHKLKKVARKTTKLLRKGDKKSKVKVFPEPDENGVIRFYVKDGDRVALIDSNLTADIEGQQLVDFMNNELNKNFRYINDAEKKKDTRYANLPNVTVDELNSPYVEFGGYQKGLENQQFGMIGRFGANARDMVDKFAQRFNHEDIDADNVDDDDYQNGLGDGNTGDSGNGSDTGSVQDPDPIQEAVDRLMSYPDFDQIPRDGVEQIVGAFVANRDSFSDELKARIDELLTSGTYVDASGNHVPMTTNALGELLSDVQQYVIAQQTQNPPQPQTQQQTQQTQQQTQNQQQPTNAFVVDDAFATLSAKYGASYPADELQDRINEISLKFDSITDPDLQRVVLETLTSGTYEFNGAVVDVTPSEFESLVAAIDSNLGIGTPVPQP